MTHLDTYIRTTGHKARDIARKAGIDEPRLSRLRNGKARPTLEEAFAIDRATSGAVAAALWVSTDEAAA